MTEAALFYESVRPGLGALYLDDVKHALDIARERPYLGLAVAHGFRRALLRRFPFSIIYAVESNEVVVVAVAHQRRSPNYWKGRG